jgi:alanine dehydrogenase
MPILMLSEHDVRQILTMEMAMEAVENVFKRMGLTEAENIPRSRCRTDSVMLHMMSAAGKTLHYMGYKSYTTSKTGAAFHVGLFDGQTGELLSLMQADYLGQMRTGAASGVATQYMARPDAVEVGIFGSGKQARTQALAVSKARKLQRIQVYSPNEENRRRFALEMTELCQCLVEPVNRPELACEDKDIVITATSSREPVLHGNWIDEGTHLNIIGSNFWAKAEVDSVAVRRCDSIAVDSKEQAKLEAGDFREALEEGSIHWTDVHEIGTIVVGRHTGRAKPQDVTLFKSLGIALEDVAVAALVYEKAKAEGIGKWVDCWD